MITILNKIKTTNSYNNHYSKDLIALEDNIIKVIVIFSITKKKCYKDQNKNKIIISIRDRTKGSHKNLHGTILFEIFYKNIKIYQIKYYFKNLK